MKRFIIHHPVNLSGDTVALFLPTLQELNQGDEIQLVDGNDQDVCYAEVLDLWVGPLGQIPAVLLELGHDPLCRTFTGLNTFLSIWGQVPTKMDTEVSAIVIRPKSSTLIRPTGRDIANAKGGSLRRG